MEEIVHIGGYMANSIPDMITPSFVGYGNMPNLVPENHGLYLGVSIASIPEISLPNFQLSFGDKFTGETGDLIFICANYCLSESDVELSLSNIVCLDEATFKRWFENPNYQPPEVNEWCVIPFDEFKANKPSLPITKGSFFETLMAFQSALSICIEQLLAMKAMKEPAFSNIFFSKETEGDFGGEAGDTFDEDSKNEEGSNGDGDQNDDTSGNNHLAQDRSKKKPKEKRGDQIVQPKRSSRLLKSDDDPDPFKMPPAPVLGHCKPVKGVGKQAGRGRGGGKKSGGAKKYKIAESSAALKEPPKQRPRKGDNKELNTIEQTPINSIQGGNQNYTTPMNNNSRGSSDGSDDFKTHMSRQLASLEYNTSVANSMLGFAERWFHRYRQYYRTLIILTILHFKIIFYYF